MTAFADAASLLADAWRPALDRSYRLGHADGFRTGYAAAERDMQRAWSALAATVRAGMNDPTLKELERLRTPDYQPCAARCGSCSRCICAEAYARRGGPFTGIRGAA